MDELFVVCRTIEIDDGQASGFTLMRVGENGKSSTAMQAAIAAMHFSASCKPAPNKALPSGIISEIELVSPSRCEYPHLPISSFVDDRQPDGKCHQFCPGYEIIR
jgi:hypothetical protein